MPAGSIQKRLCRPAEAGAASTVLSWALWIGSVLVTSTLLSTIRDSGASMPAGSEPAELVKSRTITKRQDACVSGGVQGEYNTPLHVGALVIILSVSSMACAFPMLAKRFPVLRIPENFFFAVRHFGTGVLIATAFVHLLPTAFISLGDPCLSGFWTTDYPAVPGAIALAGIFFVAVIEMVFSPARYFSQSHCAPPEAIIRPSTAGPDGAGNRLHPGPDDADETPLGETTTMHVELGPVHGRHDSISRQLSRLGGVDDTEAPEHARKADASGKRMKDSRTSDIETASYGRELSPEQQLKKQILQCMLLEVGILFHSVFIGMALSVSVGTSFVVLLVAISFHREYRNKMWSPSA